MSSNRTSGSILARRLLPLLAVAALAACASHPDASSKARSAALTPSEQYPLNAVGRDQEVLLAPHPDGLSAAQTAAMADVAERWLKVGRGEIVIREPLKGVDPRIVAATSLAAESQLLAFGVPSDQVRRAGYDPGGDASPAVIIAFTTYEAEIPKCGRDWENLSTNADNRPMNNFGCAVTADMAAQIADPADIAGPRPDEPADAARRVVVLGKYEQGQPTGSVDQQATVNVSGVGGN